MRCFGIFWLVLLSVYTAQGQDLTEHIEQGLDWTRDVTFEHFGDCQVYQFFGTDSLNAEITKSIAYNSEQKIIGENFTGYKSSRSVSTVDGKYIQTYNDENRLIERTFYENEMDPGLARKWFYFYTEEGLLDQVVGYDFERRLTSQAKEEFANGRDILDDADFEKHRTWEQMSTNRYRYNEQGQRVEKYSTDFPDYPRKRETYTYDRQGRKLEEQSFTYEQLVKTKRYKYFDGGYSYVLIWSTDGQVKPGPHFEYTFWLDEAGKVVEETIHKGDSLRQRKVIQYDSQGRIQRTILYRSEKEPEVTHVYRYRGD